MITLLTDFGTVDYFVPGERHHSFDQSRSRNRRSHPCDSSTGHRERGIHLAACYRDFPQGTIHLAIVDLGVGSQRRAIVVSAAGHLFVGPDNGIFSYIYAREPESRSMRRPDDEFFRHPMSTTFHGGTSLHLWPAGSLAASLRIVW